MKVQEIHVIPSFTGMGCGFSREVIFRTFVTFLQLTGKRLQQAENQV